MIAPQKGTRIKLVSMPNDPPPIPFGTEGTVGGPIIGHGTGQVWVAWDNGRTLNLIPNLDRWEVLA